MPAMTRTKDLIDLIVGAVSARSITVGAVSHFPPEGLSILDQELGPAEESALPAVGVYPLEEKVLQSSSSPPVTDRQLTIAMELRVRGDDNPPRIALDALRAWVIMALHANQPLRDFIRELPKELGTSWDNHERRNNHDEVASCTISFDFKYRTRYADPTQNA